LALSINTWELAGVSPALTAQATMAAKSEAVREQSFGTQAEEKHCVAAVISAGS